MKVLPAARKAGRILLDVVEIYLPSLAFLVMFVSFIVQIFTRYVLNQPALWPYELTIFGFIWTALLGACYAKRQGAHVKFTLLYDTLGAVKQTWIRLIGNSLILISFVIGFVPALQYVLFMGYKKSTVLKIPYNVAYFVFVIFLADMIGRFAVDVWQDIRLLKKGGEGTS